MNATQNKIEWEKIIDLFSNIKYLYSLCEELDPDLCTNIQPLNEFRASLDHIMRIVAIEKLPEYADKNAEEEARRLISHLRRAFFDISDMLSINYRNRIVSALEPYSPDIIVTAIPEYYSQIKPSISEIDEKIANIRTNRRVLAESNVFEEYIDILEKLKGYYKTVCNAESSLIDLELENAKREKKATYTQWIIPIGGIVIGAILGIAGWFV